MNARVQVESDPFNDAVRFYVKTLGVEIRAGLKDQSRLLYRYVIDKTPPRRRAEGRARVQKDVKKAVATAAPNQWDSKRVRKVIRDRDYDVFAKILESAGSKRELVRFTPELHKEARDRRGRVPKDQFRLTLDTDAVKQHIARNQDKVGMAKGGWAAAFISTGGSPSEWIRRWSRTGAVDNKLNRIIDPYVEAENKSPWAGRGDEDRIVAAAMQDRTAAIYENVRKKLELAAAKAAKKP